MLLPFVVPPGRKERYQEEAYSRQGNTMNITRMEGSTDVLLKIQNSRKPDQIINLVLDSPDGHFVTEGLKSLFNVKEIRIESRDLLQSLPEYAEVLAFLLETMSAAQDFNLPYAYQNEFEFKDRRYTIYTEGDYRVLKRVDEA